MPRIQNLELVYDDKFNNG